jgi:cellulose synthase operon protein C
LKSFLFVSFLISFYSVQALAYNSSQLSYEQALIHYQTKSYGEASVILRGILSKDKKDIASRVLLARILLVTGEFASAEQHFKRAMDDGANAEHLLVPLSQSLLLQGKQQEVIDLSEEYNIDVVNAADFSAVYGRALIELGLKEDARQLFQQILSGSGNKIAAYVGLAHLALLENNISEAKQWIDAAYLINNDNSEVLQLKGDWSYREQNFQQAVDYLTRAINKNPNDFRAHILLAEAEASLGNYENALQSVLKVLEKQPELPNANLVYAIILAKSGKLQEARLVSRKLSDVLGKIDGDALASHPSLKLVLGLSLFMQERWESAYGHLSYYLNLHPEHEQSHLLASEIDIKRERYANALEILNHYQGKIFSLEFYLNKQLVLSKLGQFEQAKLINDAARKAFPNSPQLIELGLQINVATGNIKEALKLVEDYDQLEVLNSDSLLLYGQLALALKEQNIGEEVITKLLAKDPTNPSYLAASAGLDYHNKDYDDAARKLQLAIAKAPKFLPLYVNLHKVYLIQGKIKLANDALQKAYSISPKSSQLLTKLGEFSQILSNNEVAASWFKKALEHDPENLSIHLMYVDSLIRDGHGRAALNHLKPMRAQYRLNSRFLVRLASAFVIEKRCQDAKPVISLINGLNESSVERNLILINMLISCGLLQDAHELIDKLERQNKELLSIVYVRIEWLLAINQPKLALTQLELLNDESVKKSRLVVIALEMLNKHNEAFKQSKVLATNFPSPNNVFKVYQLSLKLNREKEGIDILEAYVDKTSNVNIHMELAKAYLKYGDKTKAEQHFKNIASRYQSAEVYRYLSIINKTKDLALALQYAKQAYELDSKSARVLMTYGWLLTLNDQPERALQFLRIAYQMEPEQPTLIYRLAESLYLTGRIESAVELYKKASQYDFPELAKVTKRLREVNQ